MASATASHPEQTPFSYRGKLSFGPIGWLMISEVFPLRLRGRGLSIAVLVNFGASALVTFSFSPLKSDT
ncbi:Major facilitator, sugar transporter-like [Dillenia turbinata]|uniref:Major facilitator, sugar transporter-like n=1 Tax=Dillenia turbinata TaxID=194707 RepID=A0AAN8Z5Y3_9MAGN